MAQCFPELCLLKLVTLIPASLLKHIFIDTNGILSRPHIDSAADKEWKTNFADLLNADEF